MTTPTRTRTRTRRVGTAVGLAVVAPVVLIGLLARCDDDPSPPSSPGNSSPAEAYYANCDDARAAGVTPLHSGDPGYRDALDRDGDGIACD